MVIMKRMIYRLSSKWDNVCSFPLTRNRSDVDVLEKPEDRVLFQFTDDGVRVVAFDVYSLF